MNVVKQYGLKEPISMTGRVTALGAARVGRDVIEAMADVLPRTVDMVQLQERACAIISRVIGTESGCITACAASAIVVGVAACMTGSDMARVEGLPDGIMERDEVVLQRGHSAWFGASVRQMVRLAGARVVEIGDVKRAGVYQLDAALSEKTAAALYVVSHHASEYELISLNEFCAIAHSRGVPVIVDAAAETDLARLVRSEADLICISGHKSLGGPTSGILAGRAALVEAALLHQYYGIGRAMKVGKEGIVGAMCALEGWATTDHEARRRIEQEIAAELATGLAGIAGLTVSIMHSHIGSRADRVRIEVDEQAAGLAAHDIVRELAAGKSPVVVRGDEAIGGGVFYLDPSNVEVAEARSVVSAIRNLLALPSDAKDAIRHRRPQILNRADALVRSITGWTARAEGCRRV
jgi:L-seryl-tRNA(Ser) seleniumtransferase